ncbi:family 43 glycosylhydrolase [Flavihumibacter petaseus]|uniref:Putative glycosidase n=1 Tax=Flavihumibacter petaseus NBRC 106054 TaxID=1220578 RepID=A0A0E9N6Q7_9BACT|nr:family 43 glycosylhydrolase [Flavihumibacter petaseus]GAO45483.1 putative glycosidase [Flavihumibacter petaseus NBRC 106054]
MNSWLPLVFCFLFGTVVYGQTKPGEFPRIINFDEKGKQLVRFSNLGNALDAHDGEIAWFNGTYYLYGTSYDCGFEWGKKDAPFCGFKCYASNDLVNWVDKGFLFDPNTPVWQKRCNGNTYGCFRPHVVFNKGTGQYVLWINVYDNVSGYRVFTSRNATGPFTEVAEPKLAVNSNMPAGELNNGDHDLFVDDDGKCYLAFTDWRTKGTIVIEQLSDDYLTGTGKYVTNITGGQTEAPGVFKRNGIYYVLYSDPNCGYCSGTGTSYRTAPAPLGPWSAPVKISDNSCGGQPSFVSTFKFPEGEVILYGSDLWNNAAKNEALANFYWTRLSFNADGSIKPLVCSDTYRMPGEAVGGNRKTVACAVSNGVSVSQPITAFLTGTLKHIKVTSFQSGYPDGNLELAVYQADREGNPTGDRLAEATVPVANIGWSPRAISFEVDLRVKKKEQYCVVLRTPGSQGCYGVGYQEEPGGTQIVALEFVYVK